MPKGVEHTAIIRVINDLKKRERISDAERR